MTSSFILDLFCKLKGLSTSDLHVHDFLDESAVFLTVDLLWALLGDIILELFGLHFELINSLIVSNDVVVDCLNVLNEIVVVLDVDNEDIEETEQDSRNDESHHQHVLVVEEWVRTQSPEDTQDVADDAEDVVAVNFLGAEVDIGWADRTVNLALEGTDPGGHEEDANDNEDSKGGDCTVPDAVRDWQIRKVDSSGLERRRDDNGNDQAERDDNENEFRDAGQVKELGLLLENTVTLVDVQLSVVRQALLDDAERNNALKPDVDYQVAVEPVVAATQHDKQAGAEDDQAQQRNAVDNSRVVHHVQVDVVDGNGD